MSTGASVSLLLHKFQFLTPVDACQQSVAPVFLRGGHRVVAHGTPRLRSSQRPLVRVVSRLRPSASAHVDLGVHMIVQCDSILKKREKSRGLVCCGCGRCPPAGAFLSRLGGRRRPGGRTLSVFREDLVSLPGGPCQSCALRWLRGCQVVVTCSVEPWPRPSTPKALRPLRLTLYVPSTPLRSTLYASTLSPAEDNLRLRRGSSFTHPRPSTHQH